MRNILFTLLLFSISAGGQAITTAAGDGTRGQGGDGGPATAAELNQPIAVTVDNRGNIYTADVGNDNIRKVSADGIITTIAGKRGDGTYMDVPPGYIKDGGPSSAERVWKPHGIAADRFGNVYFPECDNGTIRKISPDGIISTIAGRPQQFRYKQDSNLAINTRLRYPNGITIDSAGNIIVACEGDNKVYKIFRNGIISVIAGNGINGFSGDGGPATDAELNKPWGVAADNGNIYVADKGNNCIRKIDASGIITTIAGIGENGYDGDGGMAAKAKLNEPCGIAVDNNGNIYIADSRNDAIRLIDADGIITTVAGNGRQLYHGDDGIKSSITYSRGMGRDDGQATNAQLYYPCDVTLDTAGNLYIADDHNHVIRKVIVPQKKKELQPENKIPIPHTTQIAYEQQGKTGHNEEIKIAADIEKQLLVVTADTTVFNTFAITNRNGSVLAEGVLTAMQTQIDVSSLPKGQYYLELKKNGYIRRVSFIKDY